MSQLIIPVGRFANKLSVLKSTTLCLDWVVLLNSQYFTFLLCVISKINPKKVYAFFLYGVIKS